MIVCVCHRVSDQAIAREVRSGCSSFEELQDSLRVGTACGACTDCARDTFEQHLDAAPASACCAGRSVPARAVITLHASVA